MTEQATLALHDDEEHDLLEPVRDLESDFWDEVEEDASRAVFGRGGVDAARHHVYGLPAVEAAAWLADKIAASVRAGAVNQGVRWAAEKLAALAEGEGFDEEGEPVRVPLGEALALMTAALGRLDIEEPAR